VPVPPVLGPLLRELDSLTEARISALASGFARAEASALRSTRRAVGRRFAMTPETPDVISVLAGQLALSEAMLAWEAVYGLDPETAYAARAAVLDMGLVLCVETLSPPDSEALAEPWRATTGAALPSDPP
jgi:hypothetical protein